MLEEGGKRQKGTSSALNKNRMTNVYWKRREVPDINFISSEQELNKEYVLDEERGAREDLHQF